MRQEHSDRAYLANYAASTALRIDGDFVSCGVGAGLLELAICQRIDFSSIKKTFWLFDVFENAKQNFNDFPNVHLVRGKLPDSLSGFDINPVSLLLINLSIAATEQIVIRRLWDKLAKGAHILIGDYYNIGQEDRCEAWNKFAQSQSRMVLPLLAGQGLIIK